MGRILATASLAAWLAGPAAFAHAVLLSAVPPAGARMKTAPPSVTLIFSESLEPGFSIVTVTDRSGARVDRNAPAAMQGDTTKVLTIGLQALHPGQYKVAWRATSLDTHKSHGSYVFNIIPRQTKVSWFFFSKKNILSWFLLK